MITVYHNIRVALSLIFAASILLTSLEARADIRVGRDRALRSLVQITVQTRFGTVRRGSGYLFGASGNIVVPYHLVSDAKSVQVFHADFGTFNAQRVRRLEERSDIAVMLLDSTAPIGTSFAHLADSRNVKAGDKLFVMHHSLGNDKIEHECVAGQVGYARHMQDSFIAKNYAPEQALIEITGPFDSGSAGGLVLNENDDIVGILLGGATSGSPRTVMAVTSSSLSGLLQGTYTYGLDFLRTEFKSDAEFYDKFLGKSPQREDFNAPMSGSYIAWFGPMQPVAFPDKEFTTEVNDKIAKNWFHTTELVIDNRPLREWSASRICILPASINPWDLRDSPEQLMHFDADSKFRKVIHKSRDTDERIMTRTLMSLALPPGPHKVQYVNRGANHKASGIKRLALTLEPGRVHLLDISGLSLVSMKLLPRTKAAVGEKQSVRYELERKPLGEREMNFFVRKNRFPVKLK